MKFTVEQPEASVAELCQKIDYEPQLEAGDFNYIKAIGEEDYPRFHLLVKKESGELTFKLHLDKEKPSEGYNSHKAEYESERVRKELNRIKEVVFSAWERET